MLRRPWRVPALLSADPALTRGVAVFAVLQAVAAAWDLPSGWGWEVDGIAPRELFLGLSETLRPGHMHRYPLLQYVIVAIVSLPVLLWGLLSAEGSGYAALEARFIDVDVMTGVSVASKAVTITMGCLALLVLARVARRTLWPAAGRWAALFAMTNLTFGYYARTTNLDVPYLMWTAFALDRLLTVLERGGLRDYVAFGLYAAASIATKDQAYAVYVLTAPAFLVLVPLVRPDLAASAGSVHWRRLAAGAGAGLVGLLAMNGALWNPSGFRRRLEFLSGPAKEDWRVYTRTAEGLAANLRDLAASQAEFWWPWPLVVVVWIGVVVTLRGEGADGLRRRAFRTLPLVAAVSSLVFFTLVVGRCEPRFTLPAGFWLSFYGGGAAAAAFAALADRPAGRRLAIAAAIVLGMLAVRRPASLAVTQWHDGRREVEAYLSTLPPGTRVETYGRILYQPRYDPAWGLDLVHVHPDKAPSERPPMLGVTAIQAPFLGVFDRRPDVIVLPHGFAVKFAPVEVGAGQQFGAARAQYHEDPAVLAHFRRAARGSIAGYREVLVAETEAPAWARAIGLRTETLGGLIGSLRVFEREGDAPAPRGGGAP